VAASGDEVLVSARPRDWRADRISLQAGEVRQVRGTVISGRVRDHRGDHGPNALVDGEVRALEPAVVVAVTGCGTPPWG
jgi:hypothetical protein